MASLSEKIPVQFLRHKETVSRVDGLDALPYAYFY